MKYEGCLFKLQQPLKYEIVGTPPGTDHFRVDLDGNIFVSKNLTLEPLELLEYTVRYFSFLKHCCFVIY